MRSQCQQGGRHQHNAVQSKGSGSAVKCTAEECCHSALTMPARRTTPAQCSAVKGQWQCSEMHSRRVLPQCAHNASKKDGSSTKEEYELCMFATGSRKGTSIITRSSNEDTSVLHAHVCAKVVRRVSLKSNRESRVP